MIHYQQLTEELTKDQKREVTSWMRGISQPVRRKISNHVMGEDDTIFLPLEHEEKSVKIHPDVANHLAKHGYRIASGQDYKAGYAVDPHDRQTKIGKALQRTGASTELINKFNNDPERALKKNDNLMVAVTRDPYHVAAMSTGRGWSSCMDLDDGVNKHYLPEELRAGTHVAYLVHKNDKKIEKPIARVALKPFVKVKKVEGDDYDHGSEIDRDSPHTILRPEGGSSYGTDDGSLKSTVNKWTDTHFPMQPDSTYRKHPKVYDDDGNTRIAHPSEQTIRKVIKEHGHYGVSDMLSLARSSQVNEQTFHIASEMGAHDSVMRTIINHKRTPAHIPDQYVNHSLDTHKNPQEFAHEFIDRSYMIADKLHPKTVGKLLDRANIETGVHVHTNFVKHAGLESRHIDRMLKGSNIDEVAAVPWKLNNEHISKLIDPDENSMGKAGAMSVISTRDINGLKERLTPEHTHQILDSYLKTDADHPTKEKYGRWMHIMDTSHVSADKLRTVVKHAGGTDIRHVAWRNLITHPDVTEQDAHDYHAAYKGAIFRPMETREALSAVTQNVKDPHAMKALIDNGSNTFGRISARELLGDSLAKHHADGHDFASKLLLHPSMVLHDDYGHIKPQHFALASAMMDHDYQPKGDEYDETMHRAHNHNLVILAHAVSRTNSLSPEQHTEFMRKVVDRAAKEEKVSGFRTPKHFVTHKSDLLFNSARATGQLHPDFEEHLHPYHRSELQSEGILK